MLFKRGKAHSQDLRERVFAAADGGAPVGRIALMLFVSSSYVSKVLSRRRRTGMRTALPQVCHVAPKLAELGEAIRAEVATHPDATLAELRDWAQSAHGVTVSNTAMWKMLTKLGLRLKKSRSGPLNRIARTSPGRARSGAGTSRNSTPSGLFS